MTALIDLNDVPTVAPQDLMRIMETLIATENGLIFLKGLNEDTRVSLEDSIWSTFANEPQHRLALMVRFECLVDVFASRRLKDQFTAHGLALLGPVFAIAANQRLNTSWGFNPQKFLMALVEKLNAQSQDDKAPKSTLVFQRAMQHERAQLAA